MSEVDPPRLDSLEGSSELSDMLRSAQDYGPGDDIVSRLAANLGVPPPGGSGGGGGGGTVAPPAAPLASGAPAAAVSLKALAAAAFVAGAAVAGLLTFGGRDAPVAPPPGVPVVMPAPKVAPAAPEERADPEPSPIQTAVVPEKEPVSPSPSTNVRAVTPVVEKPSEVELVGRAQKALRADPARALALTEGHRQLYPRGTLAQEREVLAIEALAALGQGDAARARAAAFESASPGSPYAVRVARAIKKLVPAEH